MTCIIASRSPSDFELQLDSPTVRTIKVFGWIQSRRCSGSGSVGAMRISLISTVMRTSAPPGVQLLHVAMALVHTPVESALSFLIANTKPSVWLEAMRGSSETRWLYSFATRLLWDFARPKWRHRSDATRRADAGQPRACKNEGPAISQDLANTALEVAAIRRALNGREPTSILEIGAGYGRTAYGLLSISGGSVHGH